jgi:hypothetical protein
MANPVEPTGKSPRSRQITLLLRGERRTPLSQPKLQFADVREIVTWTGGLIFERDAEGQRLKEIPIEFSKQLAGDGLFLQHQTNFELDIVQVRPLPQFPRSEFETMVEPEPVRVQAIEDVEQPLSPPTYDHCRIRIETLDGVRGRDAVLGCHEGQGDVVGHFRHQHSSGWRGSNRPRAYPVEITPAAL